MRPQPLGEHRLTRGDGLLGVHRVQARGAPGVFVALHDERRERIVEFVAVRLKDAVLVFHDVEREGAERTCGAEPHEARGTRVEIRLKGMRECLPNGAVDAVGSDDHIGVSQAKWRQIGERVHLRAKAKRHADGSGPLLKNPEELLARDAAEAVTA